MYTRHALMFVSTSKSFHSVSTTLGALHTRPVRVNDNWRNVRRGKWPFALVARPCDKHRPRRPIQRGERYCPDTTFAHLDRVRASWCRRRSHNRQLKFNNGFAWSCSRQSEPSTISTSSRRGGFERLNPHDVRGFRFGTNQNRSTLGARVLSLYFLFLRRWRRSLSSRSRTTTRR